MWAEFFTRCLFVLIILGFVVGAAYLMVLGAKLLGTLGIIGALVVIIFILVFIITWLEWN